MEKQACQSIQENPWKMRNEWEEQSPQPLPNKAVDSNLSNTDSYLCTDTQNHRINRIEADLAAGEDLGLNKG